jgi:hypothetical protein
MVKFLLLSIFLFWVQSCEIVRGNAFLHSSDIKAVRVTYSLPLVYPDGKVITEKSEYEIVYHDDLEIVKYFYRFDSFSKKELIKSEDRYRYLVFHQDSLKGYLFDNYNSVWNNKKVHKDSILALVRFAPNLDTFLKLNPKKTEVDSEQHLVKESYFFNSGSEKYMVRLYFSKSFPTIPESFSKQLEGKKKMKLIKSETISDAFYDSSGKVEIPMTVLYYQMNIIPPDSISREVFAMIKRYNAILKL